MFFTENAVEIQNAPGGSWFSQMWNYKTTIIEFLWEKYWKTYSKGPLVEFSEVRPNSRVAIE